MQENKFSVLGIIFNIIFSLLLFFFVIQLFWVSSFISAGKKVPAMSYEIIRLVVYGSSEDSDGSTVSAKISILDTNGNEISAIERSWPGSYLALDFTSAIFGSNRYFFPYRVRGVQSIIDKNEMGNRKGTLLYPYFMENGECILYSLYEGEGARKELYKIAKFASRSTLFSHAKYTGDLCVDLSRCESSVSYGIFATEGGSLALVKE